MSSNGGFMNAAEYAKHRGCSDSYVRRMRRDGRLVLNLDQLVDVAASDARLGASTDPSRGGDHSKPGSDVADVVPAPDACLGIIGGEVGLREAMRRERLAKARSAELELGELAGELIRAKQATRDVFTLSRQALERMRMMSSKLGNELAAERDPRKCEGILDAEIARICDEMQKSARTWLESSDSEPAALKKQQAA